MMVPTSPKILTFVSLGNLVAVTGATLFKHLSPAGYLSVSQNQAIIRTIMASKITVALWAFMLTAWQCEAGQIFLRMVLGGSKKIYKFLTAKNTFLKNLNPKLSEK